MPYATALREWRPLAEEGDLDAQFYLGEMYLRGKGVDRDFKKATFARMFISVGDRNAAMGRVIQVRPQGATSEALFRRRLTLQRGL